MFNIEKIRLDFPLLSQQINDQPLVYLDSAATSQKPQAVINATQQFHSEENANVHRGRHQLSENATTKYEHTRQITADFFCVKTTEIVWTKGATEAINLIANGLADKIQAGDKIAISYLEHHANIVPWQQLAKRTHAELIVLPLTADFTLNAKACSEFITQQKPKIVALTHASNALGNITDLPPILAACKEVNAISVIDGAQAAMDLKPNLTELNCDFYVFSAHKMLGPTGVGGLYGRYELLNTLAPYQTGGEMIERVTLFSSTFRDAPHKFESGTPNIAGVIGFAAALNYLNSLDKQALRDYELSLFNYTIAKLSQIEGIKIYSAAEKNIGNISFNFATEHPFDLATLLDGYGIAVRSGHHCAQPLMDALSIPGTVRISLAFYNTYQDIDLFITALHECIALLD